MKTELYIIGEMELDKFNFIIFQQRINDVKQNV